MFYKLLHQLLATVLAAVGLLTFSATAQAPSDVRVALIIGNSAYPGKMALPNASNDAKDMAHVLRNMGFGVIEVRDASHAQMTQAIENANKQLQGRQGVGMLFYAGHGLQLDWHNYMVPVDAKLASAKDVPTQTVDVEEVMTAFKKAGNRMNIVVLDACRDNPFADEKTASGKGLAPLDAPTGTFLAYATAPGNVAQDGAGKNGLYTGFLLQELQKPTAKIEEVFKRVRFAVRKASNGAQVPWEITSLEDEFVFNSGIKKAVELSDEEKDAAFAVEKEDWDKIKDSRTVDPFYAFVQKYPAGMFVQGAMGVIDRLNADSLTTYTDRHGVAHDTKVSMFRVGDMIEVVRRDSRTQQETKHRSPRIVAIDAGLVKYASGSVVTTRGELVRTGAKGEVYDPPRPFFPTDGFAIGKRWASRSVVTRVTPDQEVGTPAAGSNANMGGVSRSLSSRHKHGHKVVKRQKVLIYKSSPQTTTTTTTTNAASGAALSPKFSGLVAARGVPQNWVEDEGRVLALETVTVPAGTFKAYKLERYSVNQRDLRTKMIYWMTPDLGSIIKQEVEVLHPSGRVEQWTEEAILIVRGAS